MILNWTRWGDRYPRVAYLLDGLCLGLAMGVIIGRAIWGPTP